MKKTTEAERTVRVLYDGREEDVPLGDVRHVFGEVVRKSRCPVCGGRMENERFTRVYIARRTKGYSLDESSSIRVPTCPDCGEQYLPSDRLIEREVTRQIAMEEKDHISAQVSHLVACGATEEGVASLLGLHVVFLRWAMVGRKMISVGELNLLDIMADNPDVYFNSVEKYGRKPLSEAD